MAYVLNPKTGLLEDDRIIGQKQVTNPWGQTGTLGYGATNANGQQFQTFTPDKIAPTVPADTFDNRSNPNSAWVYNGGGKWNNDKTGEVKNLVNGQDPNFAPPSTITSQPANDYVSGLKDYLTKSQAQFEEQQRQLEEQRRQRTAEFESLFAGEQKRLSQTQQEESATNKALQFRLGRSDTSYGAGEIEKLNQEHAFQQSQLQAKKAQALNELNNAINDKNFALASQMRKEYKDALKEEADMRRQQQQDYVALVKSQTEQKAIGFDTIDNYAKRGITPSDAELTKLDNFLGGTGVAKQYFESAQKKATEENQINKVQDIYKVLNTIPVGTKITIGDQVYEGLKHGKYTTHVEYDKKTHTFTTITYDETGKQVSSNQSNIAPKGSTIIPKNPIIPIRNFNEKKEFSDVLAAAKTKVGQDGKIAPWDYLSLRNTYVNRGGNPTTFDTKMKGFRDPSNPDYPVGK